MELPFWLFYLYTYVIVRGLVVKYVRPETAWFDGELRDVRSERRMHQRELLMNRLHFAERERPRPTEAIVVTRDAAPRKTRDRYLALIIIIIVNILYSRLPNKMRTIYLPKGCELK